MIESNNGSYQTTVNDFPNLLIKASRILSSASRIVRSSAKKRQLIVGK